jgi:hypothetical protein
VKLSEFARIFNSYRDSFSGLGLTLAEANDYSRRYRKPNAYDLQFETEPNDDGLMISICGEFSKQEWLELGLLTTSIDVDGTTGVRLLGIPENIDVIVSSVLKFLDNHSTKLLEDSDFYVRAYHEQKQKWLKDNNLSSFGD